MTIQRVIQGIKRRLANFIANNSAYHFLVRDWTQQSDVNVAVKLLGTEFFRHQLKPVELPLFKGQRILVIAPHQDDEVIGAGGTLVKAAKQGAIIKIIFATDGSQDNIGCSVEESVKVRNQEAKQVCEQLNASFHVLPVSNYKTQLSVNQLWQLTKYIHEFKPDVLLLPWLLDAPVKHRMVNHLVGLSNKLKTLPNMEVWGYQVHNTLYPNGYVDISEFINEKQQLINTYKSQNNHIQCYNHLSMGMSAWNSRFLPITKQNGVVQKKYAEVFFTLSSAEFFKLIAQYYDANLNQIYKSNQAISKQINQLMELVANDSGQKRSK